MLLDTSRSCTRYRVLSTNMVWLFACLFPLRTCTPVGALSAASCDCVQAQQPCVGMAGALDSYASGFTTEQMQGQTDFEL